MNSLQDIIHLDAGKDIKYVIRMKQQKKCSQISKQSQQIPAHGNAATFSQFQSINTRLEQKKKDEKKRKNRKNISV